MDHQLIRDSLNSYVDGELAPNEQRELESHLADCAVCRRELSEIQQLKALLGDLPVVEPPRSFALSPADSVVTPLRRPRSEPRWLRPVRYATSLAAILLIVLVGARLLDVSGSATANRTVLSAATAVSRTESGEPPAQTLPEAQATAVAGARAVRERGDQPAERTTAEDTERQLAQAGSVAPLGVAEWGLAAVVVVLGALWLYGSQQARGRAPAS